MSTLRVRMYNVLFGDGILVEVPDRDPATGKETVRRILIDVGNAPNKEGGVDDVFPPLVKKILGTLDDGHLDLYVMTHEHLDHVSGLRYADLKGPLKGRIKSSLKVDYCWMPASSAPNYYKTHREAEKARKLALQAHAAIGRRLGLAGLAEHNRLAALYANNNPNSTTECIDFIRQLCRKARISYLYRGMPKKALRHPFQEARFAVWAPEEDTSVYYGRLKSLFLGQQPRNGAAGNGVRLEPPAGVDLGAFDRLVRARAQGLGDNLMEIDKAANNTSLVFSLKWRGWTLLFSGDAELKSWKIMKRAGVIEPVHFLKVSHHGSHNGTPDGEIFEALLPARPPDAKPRRAYISSHVNTYGGIPHDDTNTRLGSRAEVKSTNDLPKGQDFLEAAFEG